MEIFEGVKRFFGSKISEQNIPLKPLEVGRSQVPDPLLELHILDAVSLWNEEWFDKILDAEMFNIPLTDPALSRRMLDAAFRKDLILVMFGAYPRVGGESEVNDKYVRFQCDGVRLGEIVFFENRLISKGLTEDELPEEMIAIRYYPPRKTDTRLCESIEFSYINHGTDEGFGVEVIRPHMDTRGRFTDQQLHMWSAKGVRQVRKALYVAMETNYTSFEDEYDEYGELVVHLDLTNDGQKIMKERGGYHSSRDGISRFRPVMGSDRLIAED